MSHRKGHSPVKTILIVEDDPDIGEFLSLALQQETPYHALVVSNAFQALEVIKDIQLSLLVLDFRLPYMTGIELYDQVCAVQGHIPTIVISAAEIGHEIEGRNLTVIPKPFELDEFLAAIRRALAW